jgi:glycosyltransferase involved in cell wall biosynthesis
MSRRLGRYVEDRFPAVRTTYVVPGFDFARIHDVAAVTQVAPKSSGEVRIGYPTSRRSNVTSLLVPVIEEISRRHGSNVRIEFVGWAPDALTRLDNVRLYPHIADYAQFLAFKLSRRWDIGIAPLVEGPFESYKTNVKYREYGGCRIAGVYSRVAPYTDYVTDGSTGILVDNTIPAWIEALERLIRDATLRQHIVECAYADIEDRLNQRMAEQQLKSLLEGFRAGAVSASYAPIG